MHLAPTVHHLHMMPTHLGTPPHTPKIQPTLKLDTGACYIYQSPLEGNRQSSSRLQTIAIKEIDLYVTDRVKSLTHGKQNPPPSPKASRTLWWG